MEEIEGYDRWKTTPPREPDPRYYCDQCGEPVYEGDFIYDIDEKIICSDCIRDYGRYVENEQLI